MTKFERQHILPLVIKYLKSKKGDSVTSSDIINHVASETGFLTADPSLRRLIKEVQAEGRVKFIVADNYGFRYTRSKKAVLAQIEVWEKRVATLKKQINIVRNQLD